MTGWSEGLGPWEPVIKDDKLYGDAEVRRRRQPGYAIYASVTALLALQAQGVKRARAACGADRAPLRAESSSWHDPPFYVDHLADRIGSPSLVICLDSGCGNYDQMWLTTSLRGLAGGLLTVEVLTEGVHSGDASGVVPDSFRLARALLSRLEDEATGQIKPGPFNVEIPAERKTQAKVAAQALGETVWKKFPFAGDTAPQTRDTPELILNRTWRPALTVIGADGLPSPRSAGNVLRPGTSLALSVRIPPTADRRTPAAKALERRPDRRPAAGCDGDLSERQTGAAPAGTRRRCSPGWRRPCRRRPTPPSGERPP